MTRSPYDVLGVPQTATKDEIKKAYRKKARENHPDLNPNDPQAAERMNEVNDAYDRLMNPEKYAKEEARRAGYGGGTGGSNPYGGASGGSGSGAGSGSSGYGGSQYTESGPGGSQYGWTSQDYTWEDIFGFGFGTSAGSPTDIHPEPIPMDTAEMRAAINAINANQYSQAARICMNIPSTQRNARWYYIAALANYGAGSTSLGYEQIRKACQMDPENSDYRRAMQAFQQPGRTYTQETQTRGFQTSFNPFIEACCICGALNAFCMPMGGFPILCCI